MTDSVLNRGTVFIRIVAAATINFSLAGVRPLIEGGSYFGAIPPPAIHKNSNAKTIFSGLLK